MNYFLNYFYSLNSPQSKMYSFYIIFQRVNKYSPVSFQKSLTFKCRLNLKPFIFSVKLLVIKPVTWVDSSPHLWYKVELHFGLCAGLPLILNLIEAWTLTCPSHFISESLTSPLANSSQDIMLVILNCGFISDSLPYSCNWWSTRMRAVVCTICLILHSSFLRLPSERL